MHENFFYSISFPVDISLTTGAILLNIRVLETVGILKTNAGTNSIKSLFYGFVGATALKSWNEYFRAENTNDITNFADFSVDTIVILPLVVNIWQVENKIISYGAYLGVVLGFMPAYLTKTSSDAAKYIINQDNTTDNSKLQAENSYFYTTFHGVIPAFIRGITFFKLKQSTGNEPLSAFLSGSVMSFMLDNSETYATMGINIAISGLNAATNKIGVLKFSSFFDLIYPDSSTMIAIEFAEYFLRAAKIEHIIYNQDITYEASNFTNSAVALHNSEYNSLDKSI